MTKRGDKRKSTYRHVSVGTFSPTVLMKRFVNEALDSGQISYGRFSKKFESDFSAIHGCSYAVSSNSGTSALQVALQALKELHGWKDGSGVILPATTFVASANVIVHNRLEPIFVDVDPYTYNINPELVEIAMRQHRKSVVAIMPVHLLGQAADMTSIMNIARSRRLSVVEDACEAMFASHDGKSVGSWGDIGCFSTYVAHHVVTGVGGIATTNNPDYAAKMRSLVNHGLALEHLNPDANFSPQPAIGRRFMFSSCGHSFRITELEAALAVAQLEDYSSMLKVRARNARHLTAGIRRINQMHGYPLRDYLLHPKSSSSWMMFPVVLNKNEPKDRLVRWLNDRGVETRDLLPIIGQPIYSYLSPEQYPVSANLAYGGLYVGCHQGLSTEDVQYVIDMIWEFFETEKEGMG